MISIVATFLVNTDNFIAKSFARTVTTFALFSLCVDFCDIMLTGWQATWKSQGISKVSEKFRIKSGKLVIVRKLQN